MGKCPVKCAARIIFRARRLKQPNSMPVGWCCTKKTPFVYVTAIQVATFIREAVKRECPNITTANWNKYSAHSLRIWAYVLLDEAGKNSRLHQKTPPLDGRLVTHVPPRHTGHTRHAPWGTLIIVARDHWPSLGSTWRCTPAIYDEWGHTWWQHWQISWWNGQNLDAFIMINYHEKDWCIHIQHSF